MKAGLETRLKTGLPASGGENGAHRTSLTKGMIIFNGKDPIRKKLARRGHKNGAVGAFLA